MPRRPKFTPEEIAAYGTHRPPPFRVVMEARERLAKIRKERSALLMLAYLPPKGHA
jgi:hypothetical protein